MAQASEPVSQILRDVAEQADVPGVAYGFLHLVDAAEATERDRAGLVARYAPRNQLVDVRLDVEAELFVEVTFDGGAAKQRPEAQSHRVE